VLTRLPRFSKDRLLASIAITLLGLVIAYLPQECQCTAMEPRVCECSVMGLNMFPWAILIIKSVALLLSFSSIIFMVLILIQKYGRGRK
jgi:hypothetical protein